MLYADGKTLLYRNLQSLQVLPKGKTHTPAFTPCKSVTKREGDFWANQKKFIEW